MRLSIRAFGLDLLDIELTTDTTTEYEDNGSDLSGGYLTSSPTEVGRTDITMGFTLGLEETEE